MLTPEDFLHLPYTPDLSQAGVNYACQLLGRSWEPEQQPYFDTLRSAAADAAVELAFRRCLSAEGVPHAALDAVHFTRPGRYAITLGRRRCIVFTSLFTKKSLISSLRRNPAMLLEAKAFAPTEESSSQAASDEDIFVFAFLNALLAPGSVETRRAQDASLPAFVMSPPAPAWARPAHWRAIGELVFKSGEDSPLRLEIGGQNPAGQRQTHTLTLPPGMGTRLEEPLHALDYLRVPYPVAGQLKVHNTTLNEVWNIEAAQWQNIWVYGLELTLAGWMLRSEFRRTSRRAHPGSAILEWQELTTEGFFVPVEKLHPLTDLFVRVRNWASKKP